MNTFKQERIQKFLQAMAMTRGLVDGKKEYKYSLYKTTHDKKVSTTVKCFLLRYLSQCAINACKHDVQKLVKIEDILNKELYLTEVIDWKLNLFQKLQEWFYISLEGNEVVQMSDDLVFLLSDLFKSEDFTVWGFSDELTKSIECLKNGMAFDDMVFVRGTEVYILHFQTQY